MTFSTPFFEGIFDSVSENKTQSPGLDLNLDNPIISNSDPFSASLSPLGLVPPKSEKFVNPNEMKILSETADSNFKKLLSQSKKHRKKRAKLVIKPMQQQTKFSMFPQFYSRRDLIDNSIQTRTHRAYFLRNEKFTNWLKDSNKIDKNIPVWDDFIKLNDLKTIDAIIADFLVCKFNQRGNSGGTLAGDISAIMFCMQQCGCTISGELLPQSNRIVTGATNIVRMYKDPHIGEGTRALLNPLLNAQLECCNNIIQRLRILVPSRFGLRAEHVCCDKTAEDGIPRYLKRSHICFGPSNSDEPEWVSIKTGKDKNHKFLTHLNRTVYCSCKLEGYACVVHELHAYLHGSSPLPRDDCLLRNDDNSPLKYDPFNDFAKKLAILIGIPPRHYTSHTYRKAAMTEFSLGGMDPLEIREFGKWNNISFADIYVKWDNPELSLFCNVEEYRRLRKKQGNPGINTAVKMTGAQFLTAIKTSRSKETTTIRLKQKLNKINQINKPVSKTKVKSQSKLQSSAISVESDFSIEDFEKSKSKPESIAKSAKSSSSASNLGKPKSKLKVKVKTKSPRRFKLDTSLVLTADNVSGPLTRSKMHSNENDSSGSKNKSSKAIIDDFEESEESDFQEPTVPASSTEKLSKETRELIEGNVMDYNYDSDVISVKSSSDDSD